MVFNFLSFYLFNNSIKYTVDYLSERKATITVTVEEIKIENHSYNIYYNGKLLSMGLGRELKQDLDNYFVGHKCLIEYYEKSGYVISIKVLE